MRTGHQAINCIVDKMLPVKFIVKYQTVCLKIYTPQWVDLKKHFDKETHYKLWEFYSVMIKPKTVTLMRV